MKPGKILWQLAARYLALPLIRAYASKYGGLTRFYNNEVKRVGKTVNMDQISSLLSVYELESDVCGFSPSISSLSDAVSFGLLSPLTFQQSEFKDISDGIKQNSRRASVFIENDGTLRDIDAFSLVEEYSLDFPRNVKKLVDSDNKIIHSCVFFYDDKRTHGYWWVASSSAVFRNTHSYKGETFKIPVIRINNKSNGDFYYIACESKIPEGFYLRFRFVNALTDGLLTDANKTMLAEDLSFISNNGLERYLSYAYGNGGCEVEDDYDDEPDDYGRFEDDKFIMDDMVDDAVVMKLVNRLLDDGYDEELIHVTLDKLNLCEKLVVDCPDGTQYDTIKDALDNLGIKT